MNKINQIKNKIKTLSQNINVPNNLLPIYELNDFAHPYIELDENDNYNYVVRERGMEYERKVFSDDNALLFEVFKDITSSMATDFELKNRIEGQDIRILLFTKQEELLGILDERWQERQRRINLEYLNN